MRIRLAAMHALVRSRRWLRSSDAAMIVIVIAVGAMAGLVTAFQSAIAHGFGASVGLEAT